MNGYNPLRHDCADGCYNEKYRPRIEELSRAIPGSGAFMDVDAMHERAGRFLFIEWKSRPTRLKLGPLRAFQALTTISDDPRRVVVLIVTGNPRTMEVQSIQKIVGGELGDEEPATFADLLLHISAWAERAKRARDA